MFSLQELQQTIFVDIETATFTARFEELSPQMIKAWEYESQKLKTEENATTTPAEKYLQYGALYPEFGRIVCISAAYFQHMAVDGLQLRVKSFCGLHENELLASFLKAIDAKKRFPNLCAHNGREFDFPYIAKRCIIQGLPLPGHLLLKDKAQWETRHLIDTMQLWKFSSWKDNRRLDLLCASLNIPTPKEDIEGSMVSNVFWQDKNYNRIACYCQKDVVALAQIVLRMSGMPLLTNEQISFKDSILVHQNQERDSQTPGKISSFA
jgi:predicted PolB exonuclease-like 3'-5' exonuclease